MREKLGLHMHRIADAMMCPPKFVHAIQRAKPWRNCIFLSPKGGRQKVVENVAWFIANLWTLWFASLLTFLGFQGNISIEISTPYGRLLDYFDDVFFWYITQWTMNWSDTTMNWTYLLRVELSIQQQWTEHDFCVYFDDTRENNELYFRNALFVKFSQVGGGLVSWHTFRDFELVTRLWREDF